MTRGTMEITDNGTATGLEFDAESGVIRYRGRRMLLHDLPALRLLREEIIATLGEDRARALLMRFGYRFGQQGALALKGQRDWVSDQAWYEAGPALRTLEGQGKVTMTRVSFEKEAPRFEVELVNESSYEAEGALASGRPAERPVCWTFLGIASGHASVCFGECVIFVELECRAMGHPRCRFLGKRAEDWGEEAGPIQRALEGECVESVMRAMRSEIEVLRAEAAATCSFDRIVGRSPAMAKVLDPACEVAKTDVTVLLLGESGAGKEVLARAIHYNSRRVAGLFVALNCAAAPESLVESELFGHEKGAFTGADRAKPGRFEVAEGGTLFLDEIGDMSLPVQAKFLRVLQEREFERVGGTKPIKADVRVIAATSKDIEKEVRDGRFREDLYYRVNAFPIRIPPLRERREDVLPLVEHFLARFCRETGKRVPGVSKEARDVLLHYAWPGNVRELQNAVERAVILSRGELIQSTHLGLSPQGAPAAPVCFELPPGGLPLASLERDLLLQALERAGGNKSKAAQLLGLSRSAFRYRLGQLKPAR